MLPRFDLNVNSLLLEFRIVKKDTRLTFRVAADLKRKLEEIAKAEGRSVAQIAEVFMAAGLRNMVGAVPPSFRQSSSNLNRSTLRRRSSTDGNLDLAGGLGESSSMKVSGRVWADSDVGKDTHMG